MANISSISINGVSYDVSDTTSYTLANTANTTAASAYTKANSAYTLANTANTTAASAYTKANSAYTLANTANTKTIGGTNLFYGTRDWTWLSYSNGEYANEIYHNCAVITANKSNSSQTLDLGTLSGNAMSVLNIGSGETYTLSYWGRADNAVTVQSFLYPNAVANGVNSDGVTITSADGNSKITLNEEWERHWTTWTTSDSVSSPSFITTRIPSGSTGTIYIAGIKFERGDVATDWSPAPEDTVSFCTTEPLCAGINSVWISSAE